jgi:GNAT superfamily N-acetyltransferase
MSHDVVRAALWALDLTGGHRPPLSRREFAFVEVLPDMQATRLARAMVVEEREVLARLERGCRTFAAWDRPDEIVSWLWISTGEEWAPPLRRSLCFPDGDCHGWGVATLQSHRGRGLSTALLEYAGWQMAQAGYHTMWNGILDGNLASQRAHARAGFRPVLRLTAVHEPPPTRLRARPADYADERLVERAPQILAIPTAHTMGVTRNGSPAAHLIAGRRH